LILDRGDAILQGELALFQPLDEELVRGRGAFEQDDLIVELTVLRPELDEFVSELSVVDTLHSPARSNAPLLYTARARELSSCFGQVGKLQPQPKPRYPWKIGSLRCRVEVGGGLFHQIARFG